MRIDVILFASLVILEETIKPIDMKFASSKPVDLKNCAVKPLDVAFIIDASQSITEHDFKKGVKFLQGIVSLFQIGPKKVRIAALSYGDHVITETAFGFNRSVDKKMILHALSRIEFVADRGKHTSTGAAVAYARQHFFTDLRPFARQIAVLLTSNKSEYFERAKAEVEQLKLKSVKIIAIGVGHGVAVKELDMISSDPGSTFHVKSYDALKKIRLVVARVICKGCTKQPIDFNFVFDLAQMGPEHQKILDFVTTIVYSQFFNSKQIRAGLITEQHHDATVFHLNNYTYPQSILAHLQMYGDIILSPLLTKIRKEGFSAQNGGRENAMHVAVLFLTGRIVDEKAAVNEAKLVKNKKIKIFVVDMGNKNERNILESLASGGRTRIIDATGTKKMKDVAGKVINQVCHRRD